MGWRTRNNSKRISKHYCELANLSPELQKRLVEDSSGAIWISPRFWMILVPVVLYFLFHKDIVYWLIPDGVTRKILEYSASLCGLLVIFMYVSRIEIQEKKRWIHRELIALEQRPAACLLCQYDLRGTPDESTACPECGAAIAAVKEGNEE